jgi:hypothetical protein
MLMVIFGAGASYDSVPTYLPPPTPIQPHGGDAPNKHHRPPLANELFENRPLFAQTMQLYPECEPIIPRLRALNGETVESALQDLQEKAEQYPRGHCQLAAIRYYLSHTKDLWTNVACGVTNYKTLLDQIERAHRDDELVCLVTFNYDTMLEDALADFDLKIQVLADYIDAHRFYRVFKPHGSTNWVRLVRAPKLEATSTNVAVARQALIQRAPELQLSSDFRMANLQSTAWLEGWPVFPAIAIPVDKKSHFECPQEHLDELTALLPKVTKLLLIGWRATEAHFLELLKIHLKKGVRLYTVAGSEMESANINRALQTALPGIFSGSVIDPDRNGTGFTNFVLSRRLESFLKSS